MFLFQLGDFLQAEHFMNHTGAIPQQHIPPGNFVDISTQVFVRGKNDLLVFWKTFNNYFGITAGYNHITQSFYTCTAVDIAYHYMIRVLFLEFLKQWRRTTVTE